MKLPHRKFLRLAASTTALPTVARIARAQTYPVRRPVRMIVGFPPGGTADISGQAQVTFTALTTSIEYIKLAKCTLWA
jgi:tripartite-type tricarboxylate transporter receptor subunit TctC